MWAHVIHWCRLISIMVSLICPKLDRRTSIQYNFCKRSESKFQWDVENAVRLVLSNSGYRGTIAQRSESSTLSAISCYFPLWGLGTADFCHYAIFRDPRLITPWRIRQDHLLNSLRGYQVKFDAAVYFGIRALFMYSLKHVWIVYIVKCFLVKFCSFNLH